jgi:hypothetical protein
MGDEEYATSISKDPFDTVWQHLPLADEFLGMVGMTPQEFLHVGGSGLYKHCLVAIREIVGPNQSNSLVKGLINKVFIDVKFGLEHNSERDISRMSNRKGFFNHASLTSEEVRGNFFAMVVLMHTTYGASLFEPCFRKRNINFIQARTTCLMLLAWERFCLDPQRRKDIEASFKATQRLQKRMYKLIPRDEREKIDKRAGCRGWKITKFHVMLYMAGIMLKFGCLKGVDSGGNERHHKGFMKQHYKKTQRIASKFATQIAQAEYERMLLQKAKLIIQRFVPDEIQHLLGDSTYQHSKSTFERQHYDESLDNDNSPLYDMCFHDNIHAEQNISFKRGKYNLTITLDAAQRRSVCHKWSYAHKNGDVRFMPNVMLGKVLSDFHISYCRQYRQVHNPVLNYECYTSVKYNNCVYRSDPNWNGKNHDWYDWCVVRFPSTPKPTNRNVVRSQREGTTGGLKCIARIMGFFKHIDASVPTYKNVESQDSSWDAIQSSGVDNTLYMVLHCESNFFSYSTLQRKFVYRFTMTPLDQMFVLPVTSIVGPLMVINDIIDVGKTSKNKFLAILPRHKQSAYFLNYMYANDPSYEVHVEEETSDEVEEECMEQGEYVCANVGDEEQGADEYDDLDNEYEDDEHDECPSDEEVFLI